MEEFISMVTAQLGIGEDASRSAAGGILDLLKGQLDSSTFQSVLDQLPGAEGMVGQAAVSAEPSGGGGGLMGSLASAAGSLLGGGKEGGVADIMKIFTDSGVSLGQGTQFMSMLAAFLKDKLGDDLFSAVASNLPALPNANG